jgi:hypothetical protein
MGKSGRKWQAKDRGIGAGCRTGGASCMVGGLESLVGSMVLVHLDSKVEPGFQICIRWSSRCHSCKSGGYLPVESSAEFHHNGFGISIPGIIHQVLEMV